VPEKASACLKYGLVQSTSSSLLPPFNNNDILPDSTFRLGLTIYRISQRTKILNLEITTVKMAPPAKKQKTKNSKPIIFKSPGTTPDLYFKVFSQEFHVNSMALKLNSEFFRTFLDPSGGKLPKSSSPLFTSEWFTKVDGKGSWELSSDHAVSIILSMTVIWVLNIFSAATST
jgi:hypothetical protein